MTRYSEQEEWASLYCEGGEALAQVAQRSCGCPLPGSVQGQAGQGFEQPGLVEGVPAHGRGVRLDDLQGPFQPKPFCNSVICVAMRGRTEALVMMLI